MAKGIVTPELIEQLKAIVGEKYVYTDKDKLEPYSHDEVTDPHYMREPQVVVLPATTEEVAKVVKLCYDNDTVMVPRAAGTGLAAGAVATFGGVIISIERMNKILEIDKENMVCVTEPGVTTAVLQSKVAEEGLFYGGDPCSGDSCFIGGNVATNAGGNRAVKYGVTRDQVMGIEVVTPTGEVVTLGGKFRKNATGYMLMHLYSRYHHKDLPETRFLAETSDGPLGCIRQPRRRHCPDTESYERWYYTGLRRIYG